jgi:hypothetical protein
MGLFSWGHIWIYLLANLVGGAAAAGAFLLTHPGEMPAREPRPGAPHDGSRGRVQRGPSFITRRPQ